MQHTYNIYNIYRAEPRDLFPALFPRQRPQKKLNEQNEMKYGEDNNKNRQTQNAEEWKQNSPTDLKGTENSKQQ